MKNVNESHDVAILGAGLAGTTLGAILARHEHRVVMIDRGSHPRFAIGESVLPKGSLWFRFIGDRYGVPEIANFGSSKLVCEHVAPTSGTKVVNGFLYHRAGEKQRPEESHVFIPSRTPLGRDSHLFREDTDLYLLRVAQKYGAEYRENTNVTDIDIGKSGVQLRTESGPPIRARYLIDATGARSPVATKLGLREEPTRFKTHSRSIFCHLKNVRYYDETIPSEIQPDTSYNWRDGTVQHVFDGGWYWMIPFGNNPYSKNSLCSVGIVLDTRKYPPKGLPAEEEFRSFLERFPSIAAQLSEAEAVRPWISTGRLQYSSVRSAGDRFFLASNACGFIDPLHSRGIICTNELIYGFARRLLDALGDDDLSYERFRDLDEAQQGMLDFADRHIANFYTCFESYPLWNAWLRLHVMNEFLGYMALVRRYALYLDGGRSEALCGELNGHPFPSTITPNFAGLTDLYERAEAHLDRYRDKLASAEEAGAAIIEILRTSPYLPPMFDWSRPDYNHVDTTGSGRSKDVAAWAENEAPEELRRHVFDFPRAALQQVRA